MLLYTDSTTYNSNEEPTLKCITDEHLKNLEDEYSSYNKQNKIMIVK